MQSLDAASCKKRAADYFATLDLTQTEQLEQVFDRFLDDLEDGYFLRMDSTQTEPSWHEIARTLVQYSLSLPFDTCVGSKESFYYGFPSLLESLTMFGDGLALPETANSPLQIFPAELLHHIHLQTCLEWLSGIGQDADSSLALPAQQGRIEALIEAFREHKASLQYLELNLNDLLAYLVMPDTEKQLFADLLSQHLALPSAQALLADYLEVCE